MRGSRDAAGAFAARQTGGDAVPPRHPRAVLAAVRRSRRGIGRRRRRRGWRGRRRRGREPRARAARRARVRETPQSAGTRRGWQRRASSVHTRPRRRHSWRVHRRALGRLGRARALGLLPRAPVAPTRRPGGAMDDIGGAGARARPARGNDRGAQVLARPRRLHVARLPRGLGGGMRLDRD